LERENLVVNAPSGFGKTVATLYAIVSAGSLKILWFTRTHREAERVIDEAKAISMRGRQITAISIQSRASLCPMAQGLTPEEAAVLCRERRAQCPFYKGFLTSFSVPPKPIISAGELYSHYVKLSVCPYYAQLSLCNAVDIVAASFSFLANPFAMKVLGFNHDTVVVLDEAHGLPETLTLHRSAELSLKGVHHALEEAKSINLGSAVESFIEELASIVQSLEGVFSPEELCRDLQKFTKYSVHVITESMVYWGDILRGEAIRRGERPRSSLYHLGVFLTKLLNADERYVVVGSDGKLRLACLDAKLLLPKVRSVILMSGTIDLSLANELGLQASLLDLSRYVNYQSRVFILCDVTSRFEERGPEVYESYARYIKLLSNSLPINMAVFFPSYEVLRSVSAKLTELKRPLFIEEESMSSLEHEELLRSFKERGDKGGALYLGVCGGRASEGVDFPGRELDLVFIAGVPFDEPSPLIEAKISYYAERKGEEGFYLAYIAPAIRKVIQAAGRAFRGPEDVGVVVLGDKRFKKLTKFLPPWLSRAIDVEWRNRSLMLAETAKFLGVGLEL